MEGRRGEKQSYKEEERVEWGRGPGALGGLSLHFCLGAPKFQVMPLCSASPKCQCAAK